MVNLGTNVGQTSIIFSAASGHMLFLEFLDQFLKIFVVFWIWCDAVDEFM